MKTLTGNILRKTFNILIVNPTKWSNTLKQFSVFDYFVGFGREMFEILPNICSEAF